MKIAITATGNSLQGPVEQRFGRAPGFIIYDTETKESKYVDNKQNLNAMQGAGIQSGRAVADQGAGAVLTGHVGPKAFATLDAAKIKVYSNVTGTIEEAIKKFEAGELEHTGSADVEGHWM